MQQGEPTAIYARISSDPRDTGLGVQRQLEDCQAYCEANGLTVVAELVDNDISAYSGKQRPQYDALLDLIRRGAVRKVVAWHTDRLHRRLRELVEYCDVVSTSGVTTHTVKAGDLDLSNPSGIMMAQIKGAVDEAYVSEARAKNIRARRQLAEQGKRHKTARVYGWQDDGITLNEVEAAIVREVVARLIAGEPQTRIAADLNRRGLSTGRGNVWTGIGVKKIAMRASNAAIRTYYNEEFEAVWEPIIERDTYRQLQAVVSARDSRRYKRGAGRRYLLTGFAVCGACGQKLSVGAARSNTKSAYRCDGTRSHMDERTGCGGVSRHVEPLEHLITEAVLYRLQSDDLLALMNRDTNDAEIVELMRQETEQRLRINQVIDAFAEGSLTKPEFSRAKDKADQTLADIQKRLHVLTYRDALTLGQLDQTIRERWETGSLEWRRALLDLLIESVRVHPYPKKGFKVVYYEGYRFDCDLIDVTWKV